MESRPTHNVRCGECDRELHEAHDQPERKPCPACGSLKRKHSVAVKSEVRLEGSVEATVKRGLNDVRLAVLGILVGIALTIALGVPGPWYMGVLAGVASFALGCLLIRWSWSRHYLMEFMNRVTGH